jgi:hypothetical protein
VVLLKKLVLVLFLFASVPTNVRCPEHNYASCFFTGANKLAADGGLLYRFHCTCGDDWWVRGT